MLINKPLIDDSLAEKHHSREYVPKLVSYGD